MFRFETQQSDNFNELTSFQRGWEFAVSQLGRSDGMSNVHLRGEI
jgi:hypothetical protein